MDEISDTWPQFISHYSRGEPFRSITSLPQDQWQNIIQKLDSTNAWGMDRFKDLNYLKQRVQAEAKLRNAFIAKGEKPQLDQPIYFFLGRNEQFEESRLNKRYEFNLADILSEHISFTYGDSMLSLIEENRKHSGIRYQNPLCDSIYRTEELKTLFSSEHFPEKPLHIEAQIWIMPSHVSCIG
ncbi:MAG: hypothetical protein H7Z71_09920 [Moraxellaceae bacterium]|nr:hypothetical protein [Pseudobdellovibrionaceae bacterium]